MKNKQKTSKTGRKVFLSQVGDTYLVMRESKKKNTVLCVTKSKKEAELKFANL